MSDIIGIDLRGDTICTASAGESNGRRLIHSMAQMPVTQQATFPDNARLAVAVPDHIVMVKNYLMRNGGGADLNLRLQFEMEQSLLESPELFQFDTIRTGLTDRYLGLIYRKDRLSSLGAKLGIAENSASTDCLARAAALGRGFRTFCRMSGGELQGVIDFTPTDVSLCLLYHGEVTSLGHLNLDGYDLASEMSLKRLAMEVKTLVSFKLASLGEMGLSLPLSALAVSGESLDTLVEQLLRYFPNNVSRAEVNAASVGESVDLALHPELFLPALGLTVI